MHAKVPITCQRPRWRSEGQNADHLQAVLGFLVLAGAAAAAFVYFAPTPVVSDYAVPSASTYASLISAVLADDAANNLRTEGAPQQTVVNGWTARDLLTVIAKQNADNLRAQGAVVDATGNLQTQPFDQRIPALLLIAVLAICWSGISGPVISRPVGVSSRTVVDATSVQGPAAPIA